MKIRIVPAQEISESSGLRLDARHYVDKVTDKQFRCLELMALKKSHYIGLYYAKQLEKKGLVKIDRQMSRHGVERVICFWVSFTDKGRRVYKQEKTLRGNKKSTKE